MKNKKSILILVLLMLMTFTACSKPSEDKISSQMKAYLYEKYGEEFEVDSIGMRSANDQKFYEARIYPKAIIGTPKEDDKYYYGSASIDVDSIGRLDKETGDDYSFIRFNDDTENYLLPKIKELFGDRVRIKVDASLKIRDTEDIIKKAYEKIGVMGYKPQNIFLEYKESNFKKAQKRVIDNPKNNRLELSLYLYIFDKIDNEKEKEERRKDIFDFIQYLKKEGLFEYLAISTYFIDERYFSEQINSDTLNEMKTLKKEELNSNIFEGYNQLTSIVISPKMIEIDVYKRVDDNEDKTKYQYKKENDVEFGFWENYLFKEEKTINEYK